MNVIKSKLAALALAGNLFYIVWILYNDISENFQRTLPEKVSYITLMGLLSVNSFLLLTNSKEK